MGVCLSQELAERYAAGTCPDDELRAIEVHLAECKSCRRRTDSARLKIASPAQPGSAYAPGSPKKLNVDRTLPLDDAHDPQPPSQSADSSVDRSNHSKPVEKNRVLGDEQTSRKVSKSKSPASREPASTGRTDRTLPLDDKSPAESASQLTTFPSGGQNFAKVLESMISGYEVLEEMPRGGQAAVYKAIHTATRTKVAIKVLLPTLLASARARHYFEREAELIASLDHPNIVSIRDSGIIHHQYYFVMQYIDGQPLE